MKASRGGSSLNWPKRQTPSFGRALTPSADLKLMELLENTHKRHPADRDTLLALVSIAQETGDFATALRHARELVALYPTDMQLRLLVLDLEKRQVH
jgi:Tfp pilus assembly protein PilF